MKISSLVFVICLLTGSAFSTTYYVDYANGVDTNSGTSTSTPWKHAPGMLGCSNTCLSITPASGDIFYLKGNVTWPNASLGWLMSWNGTSGNPIYFGVLSSYFAPMTGTVNTNGAAVTWITGVHGPGGSCNSGCNEFGDFTTAMIGQTITINGGSCTVATVTDATHLTCTATQGTQTGVVFSINLWGRPVLDAGGIVMGSQAGLANVMVRPYGNYLIIDNLELKGLFWTGAPGPGEAVYIEFAGGTPGKGTHDEIKNVYIHGWSHDPNTSPTFTQDTNLILGDSGVPNNNVASSVHDSVITGEDNDRSSGNSGGCIFGGPALIYRIWCEYADQGFVGNGITTFHDNTVLQIGPTFQQLNHSGGSGVAHTNGLELNAQSTDVTVYNNVIYAMGSGTLTFWCATNSGVNCYAFNNVFYNTDVNNILDPAQSVVNNGCSASGSYCNVAGNFFYYNNTVECGPNSGPTATCQGGNSAITAITHQNNHYITSGSIYSGTPVPILTTNLLQSLNTACSTYGYCYTQTPYVFYPTSGSGPTAGAGTSLSTFCSTVSTLDSTAGAACLLDTTYGVFINRTSWSITSSGRIPNSRKATPDIGAYEYASGTNYTLTVAVPSGGTVTDNTSAINCPGTCSASYSAGTVVTLTATPSAGYAFVSWSGACSGSSNTCSVTMSANESVTATFTGVPIATLSTTSIAFGSRTHCTTSSPRTVTLTNTGHAVLNISSIGTGETPGCPVSAPLSDFSDTTTCGSTLAVGLHCNILVKFTPQVAGARSGTLSIVDDAADSPQTVLLTGTGQ